MRRIGGIFAKKRGKAGQEAVKRFLATKGAICVEEVATPVITRRIGKLTVVVGYKEKVSCDFYCQLPFGDETKYYVPCKIEVKTCDDDKLDHSRLDDHQADALHRWSIGGYSFVAWVRGDGVAMFKYPMPEFRKGKSITWDEAKKLSV